MSYMHDHNIGNHSQYHQNILDNVIKLEKHRTAQHGQHSTDVKILGGRDCYFKLQIDANILENTREIHSKPSGSGAKSPESQIKDLTSVSILTHFLLTDKLLGYFPVNLDQFAASGNVSKQTGCKSVQWIPSPMCGDRTRWLCRQGSTKDRKDLSNRRNEQHEHGDFYLPFPNFPRALHARCNINGVPPDIVLRLQIDANILENTRETNFSGIFQLTWINLQPQETFRNKRDVNRSSGSCARALERHDPFLGGGAVAYVWGSH
eukprot:sb/3468370/